MWNNARMHDPRLACHASITRDYNNTLHYTTDSPRGRSVTPTLRHAIDILHVYTSLHVLLINMIYIFYIEKVKYGLILGDSDHITNYMDKHSLG